MRGLKEINMVEKYGVRWVVMPDSFMPVSRFRLSDWHKIFDYLSSDEEFYAYRKRFSLISNSFLLYDRSGAGEPIGFCFLIYDDYKRRSVMIHGGTWLVSRVSSLRLCQGLIGMAERLLEEGFKVHSQCHTDNTRSLHFLRGCGFRPYRYDENNIKLYLTPSLIASSKIFKRISSGHSLAKEGKAGV